MKFLVGVVIGIPSGALAIFFAAVLVGVVTDSNLAGLAGLMLMPVGAIAGGILGGMYWASREPKNDPPVE